MGKWSLFGQVWSVYEEMSREKNEFWSKKVAKWPFLKTKVASKNSLKIEKIA